MRRGAGVSNSMTSSARTPTARRTNLKSAVTPTSHRKRLPPLSKDRYDISTDDEGSHHGHQRHQSQQRQSQYSQSGWRRQKKVVDTQASTAEVDAKIEDLMNTLECPVCLDTADHPPIYQCPEGHLLCEACNQRLSNCPQCGHALLNSRNRTAEGLALKLQLLQGNQGRNMSDQSISISVSEPRKARRGLFAPIVYTINSKIRQETRNSSYSVTREYKDFLTLHAFLAFTYTKEGVIVPPPPAAESLKTVATVASLSPDEDLSASSASQVIGSRCVALDRYLKRLVRHPVVRKDPNFRSFIQENSMPKSLKTKSSWSKKVKEMISKFRSKMSVKEKDPWFVTRKNQLNVMSKQLLQMKNTLGDMSLLKLKLHHGSDQFRNDLVLMLVSRNSDRENGLGLIINEVLDCHRTMSTIYEEQSIADRLIVELATDYALLVESAMEVITTRRNLQMELERAEKKGVKALKTKNDDVSNVGEHDDEENSSEELKSRFEQFSRTLRRELEHFDVVMKEEFESAFSAYKASYWRSLQANPKAFSSPDGGPYTLGEHLQELELYPSLPIE